MPPHLHKGKPALQRQIVAPSPMFLCNCTECALSSHVNSNGEVLTGCWVTPQKQQEHRRRDKNQQIANEKLAEVSASTTPTTDPYTGTGINSDDIPRSNFDDHGTLTMSSQPNKATLDDLVSDYISTSANSASPSNVQAYPREVPGHQREEAIPEPRQRRRRNRSKSTKDAADRLKRTSPPLSMLSQKLSRISKGLAILPSEEFLASLERHPLVFINPPTPCSHVLADALDSEMLELDPFEKSNQTFIQQERFLHDSLRFLSQLHTDQPGYSGRIERLIPRIKEEQARAAQIKNTAWMQQQEIFRTHKQVIDTSRFSVGLKSMDPIVCLVYLISATAHFLGNLSLDHFHFFLPALSMLVQVAMKDSPSFHSAASIRAIPSDVRTVITSLQVDPIYNALVCCPSCFQTYKFKQDDPESYPEHCTYRSTPNSSPCGRRLKTVQKGLTVPKRLFTYQDLSEWIARMYSRPEIEEHLDNYPKQFEDKKDEERKSEVLDDIWDGSVLKNFLGPDGRHFMDKPESEGQLVFGLNMDGFNPYGNKEAGKHVTICGIYLVCLNLPPEIRYKSENIFLLGIVPGPQEPSTHEVNHVVRPLVDDLLPLWYNGLFLTKTTKHPTGRLVRCALIPVICDLPAARRIAGFGGHSAGNFCSECLLKLDDINELDQRKWKPRNYTEHCVHAQKWRDATTENQRTSAFQEYGAKWSELLRLPYWDPTSFVVIDSMHGFYLRLFHRHIRDVWGMSVELEDGDGCPDINLTENEIIHAHRVLQFGTTEDLQKLPKNVLQYLCSEAGFHYGGRRRVLIKQLIEHRVAQKWPKEDGTVLSTPTIVIDHTAQSTEIQHSQTETSQSYSPPTVSPACPSGISLHVEKVDPTLPGSGQILDQPMLQLYESPKTQLLNAPHEDLVGLSILKLGGPEGKYKSLSKKALVDGLHDVRKQDGIVDDRGHIIKRKAAKGKKSAFSSTPEVSDSVREELDKVYQTGSKTSIARLKKSLLVVLCAMKLQRTPNRDFDSLTKKAMGELLDEARLADGIINEDGAVISEQSNKKDAMLGHGTLEEIRKDMEKITLPTWYTPAPKHPGEVKWGKFKAAEWKSFCTVNLPITLTRLWGSLPKDSPHYLMLENFLHLVTAVKIADRRSITFDEINLYEHHMKAYLSGFIKLYPFISISPYQHLSLHFPAHLKRFGPTHSWRCFAFERYNGLIQKLPSNNKIGEIEKSKFIRFCRIQNLRALFAEAHLPQELKPIVDLYETNFGNQGVTISSEDAAFHTEPQKVPKGEKYPKMSQSHLFCFDKWMKSNHPSGNSSFVSAKYTPLSSVKRFRQRFVPGEGGNSVVAFRSHDNLVGAGRITSLFSYRLGRNADETAQTFAILQRFRSLSLADQMHDIYRNLPTAAGNLVYNLTDDSDLILVPISQIISHVGTIKLSVKGIVDEVLQVIPLA